jgi:hypothetical protein
MGKRLIISESERETILGMHSSFKKNGVILEQTEEANLNKAIQCFLNKKGIKDNKGKTLVVDGMAGDSTQEALSKYQNNIGVYPADGVFGPSTKSKMPQNDKEILKQCASEHGDLIDKALHWLGID